MKKWAPLAILALIILAFIGGLLSGITGKSIFSLFKEKPVALIITESGKYATTYEGYKNGLHQFKILGENTYYYTTSPVSFFSFPANTYKNIKELTK